MLNHITVMGRLVADPELRKTPADISVCSFRIACDRDYKPKDAERETDFINVTAWRSTAEFAGKYFAKGRMAIVDGRLQIRNYTDRDGNKRTAAEIVASNIYFGDSKPKDDEDGEPPAYEDGDGGFGLPEGFDPGLGGGDGELPF